MAKDKTNIFKPDATVIELGGVKYRLVYDLNAFCEIDKLYGNVDTVLRMLFSAAETEVNDIVTYNDCVVNASDIMVSGTPLPELLAKLNETPKAASADTLNLLWIGVMHETALYNDFGEIVGYSIRKRELGSKVNLGNMKDVNSAIVSAIINDLVPQGTTGEEAKNE